MTALSRHTLVCHAAQENRLHATPWVYWQEEQSCDFYAYLATSPNGTKFIVEVPSTQGKPHSKFKENLFHHSWDMSNQAFEKISSFIPFFSHTVQKSL